MLFTGLIKKGLLLGGLAAGAMFLTYGAKSLHYARYAAHKVQHNARAAVPFEADVDAARQQVKALDPALKNGVDALLDLEQGITQVRTEIASVQAQLGKSGERITALNDKLAAPGIQRVSSGASGPAREQRLKAELAHEIDSFKRAKFLLEVKQQELQHREAQRLSLEDKLREMKAKKETLLSKIREIEARHDMIELTRDTRDFEVDTSPIAEAERAVADLEERIARDNRRFELQTQFLQGEPKAATPTVDPVLQDRDVQREASEILNQLHESETDSAPATGEHDA